jgi:hypothetical protein
MKHFVLLFLLAVSGISNAMCFAEAGNRYGIPEDLLRAIARVESSNNPAATNLSHIERTKSYDIGVMQVNSSWLPRLAAMGITEPMLREPCQNVMVGAWILSHHLREAGADWNGVGSYNASCRTLSKQQCENARYTYAWKVYRALMKQRNLVPEGASPAATTRVASAAPLRPTGRFIRTVEVSAPSQNEARQDGVQQARIARTAVIEADDLNDRLETD